MYTRYLGKGDTIVIDNNTKDIICQTAWDLLLKRGYKAFSLKAVADQCGIGRSNVYYYFKNKKDLLVMLYDHFIDEFSKQIEKVPLDHPDPWIKYITVQYAYLLTAINHKTFKDAYIEATKSPEMRTQYIEFNNNLFLRFVDAEKLGLDLRDVFFSSVAASGTEFEMMYLYSKRPGEISFEYAMGYSFKVRLHLLDIPHAQIDMLIKEGIEHGKKYYSQLKKNGDWAL